ncbi:MAG: lytic transglycosylase domain-containing protein [Lentisphaeria bacterium]|nr:lytic transglycosylase domain-containing protein [Lentisphaeria bacterium]
MRDYSKNGKKRLTGGQAAFLLFLFGIPAILAGVLIWEGVCFCRRYFDRYQRYDSIIEAAGRRNGVDPALLKAVIWRESRFDRDATGTKGEVGLMQIMVQFAARDWADAHKRPAPTKGALSDPELNIEIGSWYLGRALRRWAEYREGTALALCEYNAGLTRAEAWKPPDKNGTVIDRIDIASTASYVTVILTKQKEYAREFRDKASRGLF